MTVKIIRKKKAKKKVVRKTKALRARELFAEYVELHQQKKEVTERMEEIKEIVKGKLIPEEEGFILCDIATGEGFRKSSAPRLVPNEEKMRKAKFWKSISVVKRIFDEDKTEQLVASGKLKPEILKKYYDEKIVYQLRIGKEE